MDIKYYAVNPCVVPQNVDIPPASSTSVQRSALVTIIMLRYPISRVSIVSQNMGEDVQFAAWQVSHIVPLCVLFPHFQHTTSAAPIHHPPEDSPLNRNSGWLQV